MSKQKLNTAEDYAQFNGTRFGTLTIVSFADFKVYKSGKRLPRVNCLCDCGNTKVISLWDLKRRASTTCGDRSVHRVYDDRSIPAFNQIYRHSYKFRALKAGIEFAITEDEFRTLSQQNCHYCGVAPEATTRKGMKGTCKTGKFISIFVYNGLDRLDSTKGYTLDNVVPCCSTCNHAKHTMGYDAFIAWIDRLITFRAPAKPKE